MRPNSEHLARIVRAITPANNQYRDPGASTSDKLEALWEMGDQLLKLGVKSPHSVGWAVQSATHGLIKRPTVFRSHKIRTIWPVKKQLMRDIGKIPGLSRLRDVLPLIDPAQPVRHQLTEEMLRELYRRCCEDSPSLFNEYLSALKSRFAVGRLGQPLDRSKHLAKLGFVVRHFRGLFVRLQQILESPEAQERDRLRAHIAESELIAFSNMCIALTTRDNIRLYKRCGPQVSASQDPDFLALYAYFGEILSKQTDESRARLRRLISADALARLSDMVSSVRHETAVQDYHARRALAIEL